MRVRTNSTGIRLLIGSLLATTVFALALNASDREEQQGPFDGQWWIETKSNSEAQLTLQYQRTGESGWNSSYMNSSATVLASAEGLTKEQIASSGAHVSFRLLRDPGNFECEGWFANGKGSGHFRFAPNAEFLSELHKRGFNPPTAVQQFQMALSDFRLVLLDELKSEGYAAFDTDTLVRMATHGVRVDYVRGMKAAGYHFRDADDLVRFHDHGVDPAYVSGLAEAGYTRLSAEDLLRSRDHGVTPEFIRGLAELGFKNLTMEDAVRTRDHGITPAFIGELRAQGYTNISLDQLVRARDHGVEPAYIAEVKAAGFPGVELGELVRLRDHGVSPGFLRHYKNGHTIDEIIHLKDLGESGMD